MEERKEKKAPIIQDGKTLDELIQGSPFMQRPAKDAREEGATDQEIWEDFLLS